MNPTARNRISDGAEPFEKATLEEVSQLLDLLDKNELTGHVLSTFYSYVTGELPLYPRDYSTGAEWMIHYIKDFG